MEIFPKTLGTRPRLAVEVRAEGIVAARAEDSAGLLLAIAHRTLSDGAVFAGLRPGNIADRLQVVTAVREALDAIAVRGGDRSRYVTVVVPDVAVRVLLLDFDDLPGKPADALPVIRFRLKKLLPFDSDTASVSYQVMSSERGAVRVLAVAMPREVLDEYEAVLTAAGYLSGAVLPSTLAALSGLDEQESAALMVNVCQTSVTTAIVHHGVLLLHRAVELAGQAPALEAETPAISASERRSRYDRIEAEAAIETQVLESAESEAAAREIAQAVSVAAAYFEDTLAASPEKILSAGTLGADGLGTVLAESGFTGARVQESVTPDALGPGIATTRTPRGWLAGVRGALRN